MEKQVTSRSSCADLRSEATTMADSSSNTRISRRSTRLYGEEMDLLKADSAVEVRLLSKMEDRERDQRSTRSSSFDHIEANQATILRRVDLGRDMNGLFPTNHEDLGKQVTRILEDSRTAGQRNNGRPLNFGDVIPGIYRSSYPQAEEFEFLKSLKLKTIVTLVKKDFPEGFSSFIAANGIRHIVIDMAGTKKVSIPQEVMSSIMKVVLDESNHPLLIHCNHGKHRTGCVTAVIRHVTGWHVDSIVTEYTNYAQPKVRECDVEYIKQYQVGTLKGLFLYKKNKPSKYLRSKMLRMFFLAVTAVFLFWSGFPVSTVHI